MLYSTYSVRSRANIYKCNKYCTYRCTA